MTNNFPKEIMESMEEKKMMKRKMTENSLEQKNMILKTEKSSVLNMTEK